MQCKYEIFKLKSTKFSNFKHRQCLEGVRSQQKKIFQHTRSMRGPDIIIRWTDNSQYLPWLITPNKSPCKNAHEWLQWLINFSVAITKVSSGRFQMMTKSSWKTARPHFNRFYLVCFDLGSGSWWLWSICPHGRMDVTDLKAHTVAPQPHPLVPQRLKQIDDGPMLTNHLVVLQNHSIHT